MFCATDLKLKIAVHQQKQSKLKELEQFCLEEWAKIPVARCAKLIDIYIATLHITAGLLLKLSRVGPGQSLDERPDAAGSGVEGPVGGTLSSGLKISQCPCRMLSFGRDVKRVS